MYLEHISLLNFKNIGSSQIAFRPGINGLVGDNGAGKSNVLDAIYFLSMSKSMLPVNDSQSVKFECDFFMIDGRYRNDESRTEQISCSYNKQRSNGMGRGGKILKRNGKEYERLSDHMGLIPVVVVSPYDSVLISDSAEERRRFLNMLISQFNGQYLASLIRYNALLSQRNTTLRNGGDEAMLHIYDQQMMPHATLIEECRRNTIEQLLPLVTRYYNLLSSGREGVNLNYKSTLTESDYAKAMMDARERDRNNGYSTVGIHRDDITFEIEGQLLRKFGSQGQQKSFLVALKLAQYQLVSQMRSEHPILLLDDLFDKLDRGRVEQLVMLVAGDDFGQIFISDCNQERLQLILDKVQADYGLYHVSQGEITDGKRG